MSFVRRPFLASGTDVRVLSEPVIYGSVHVNVDGGFDDVGAGSYGIELATESCASLQVTFTFASAPTLQDIVDGINTAASALSPVPLTASAIEGVLCLKSTELGSVSVSPIIQAFIEVLPLNLLGATDLAPLLGFYVSPHPAAKVTAGDLASSSPRAMTQHNRPSASFIARGEDRTSENFNRALHSLAKNLDNHQVKMVREVAVPVVLEIPEDSAHPNPRFIKNVATGEVDFIDLRTGFGDDLDTILAGNIFVDLPDTATVEEISKYFAIVDAEWNEILSLNRVVRVGTVAFAPSGSPLSKTTYDEDGNALSVLLTSATFNAFRNVLGHESTKTSATSVTKIIDGATIVAKDATFVTDGVEPGDIAELADATDETPRTNIGRYVVDAVVSETMLIVRPETAESLHLLNPASGETITIRSNGKFESSLVIAPEPPLPRVPSGGIKIILGMQNEFGAVPQDFLLVPAVNSAEEVDGWVLRNLHRNMNLDGIYKGQGQDKGSGFFAETTHRPFTVFSIPTVGTAASDRTSAATAEILAGNLLRASGEDSFSLADLGRSINFVIGVNYYYDWRIVRWIDGRTVEVVPPPHQIGTVLSEGAGVDNVSSWEIFDDLISDFRAAFMSVTESPRAGGFHHIKMNDSSESGDLSFAHFEHVTQSIELDGTTLRTDLAVMTGLFSTSGVITDIVDSAAASVDPDDLRSVFPITHGGSSARRANGHGAKSYVRVLTGLNAGLYEIYEIRPNQMTIRGLDGAVPTFTGTHQFSILNLRLGVGVPIFGGANAARAGLSVFQESEPNSTSDTAYGIRAGWAGIGAGILVTANDSEFSALTGGRSVSAGPAIQVDAYAPAYGALISVEGNPSSSTSAGRGQYGVRVVASTSAHNLDKVGSGRESGGRWKGAGVVVEQQDADPAGVFQRNQETTWTGDPAASSSLYPSTLVVEDWLQVHRGAGRGAYVHGDFFGSDSTGLYFGSALTAESVYSRVLADQDETSLLGSSEVTEELTADVLEPDFTAFNMTHDFIVAGSFVTPPERLVGLRIRAGVGLPLFEGLIVAATETQVAVRRSDSSASTPPELGLSTTVIGNGWWRAYLNLADFMFIGTGITASSRGNADLGLIYSGQRYAERNDFPLDRTETQRTAERLSPVQAWSDPVSERIGQVAVSEALSNVDGVDYATYTGAVSWTSSPTSPLGAFYFQTPWETETGGYSAIARHLLIHTPDGSCDSFSSGDQPPALVSDFQLISGDFLTASQRWGGSVQVGRLSGTGTVSVFKRLQSSRLAHISVKLVCRMSLTGSNPEISLKLRNLSRGDAVVSLALQTQTYTLTTGYNTGDMELFEVDLSRYANEFRIKNSDYFTQDGAVDTHILGIEVEARTCSAFTIAELSVEEIQIPEVHVGPVMIQGTLQTTALRYTDARRGFDSISPSRVHFLSGVDFGVAGNVLAPGAMGAWADTGYGSDRYHAQHEGHNQPWLYIRDPGPVAIQSDFNPATTFYRGVSSLAVYGTSTGFDPAALVRTWEDDVLVSGDIANSIVRVVFPGMTGFVGDIDAPHGSLLTTLSLHLSARPPINLNFDDGAVDDHGWGIYHSVGYREPLLTTGTVSFVGLITASREAWESAAGVRVSLWRHRHATDLVSQVHPGSKLVETLPAGFSEKIGVTTIDFDAVDPQDFLVNPANADLGTGTPYERYFALREEFFQRNLDLTSMVSDLSLLKVDRRHFSYSFTVEFYIGVRKYTLAGDISDVYNAGQAHPSMGAVETRYAPVVKFRGAQIGYLTDRPAHGGW